MSLQKPQIIDIEGKALMIKHPGLAAYVSTSLAANVSADANISVYDNLGFEDGDHVVIGTIGRDTTEARLIDGAVTRGQALTLDSAPTFSHKSSEPVIVCPEAKVKIYKSVTDDFADAVEISTVDIQFGKQFTTFYIPAAEVGNYYFASFLNAASGEESDPSLPIPAIGYDEKSAAVIIGKSLANSNSAINDLVTYEFLIAAVDEAQKRITQIQDPTGSKKNWSFEIAEDYLIGVQDKRGYSLANLARQIKYSQSNDTFIEVIFDNQPLGPMSRVEIEIKGVKSPNTTVASVGASVGDTSLAVRSTGDFNSDGTIVIEGQSITYTGKTDTSFTGIPATGTGSITANIDGGAEVWLPGVAGKPSSYCISQNKILFDLPLDNVSAGKTIYIRYYSKVGIIEELGDLVYPEFVNLVQDYVIARIEYTKGSKELAAILMKDFEEKCSAQMLNDTTEVSKVQSYYNFDDGIPRRDRIISSNL